MDNISGVGFKPKSTRNKPTKADYHRWLEERGISFPNTANITQLRKLYEEDLNTRRTGARTKSTPTPIAAAAEQTTEMEPNPNEVWITDVSESGNDDRHTDEPLAHPTGVNVSASLPLGHTPISLNPRAPLFTPKKSNRLDNRNMVRAPFHRPPLRRIVCQGKYKHR